MAPLYDEFVRRFQWQAAHLSDKVLWRLLAAPGVVVQKQSNALQRTYLVRGPDLSSEVQEVQGALMLQANNVLKRLGGTWTIHSEAQRVPVTTYPDTLWPHPVAELIDDERKRAMIKDPGSFETFYFLTFTWVAPGSTASLADRLFVRRHPPPPMPSSVDEELSRPLEAFLTQSDYLMYLLRGMLAVGRPLTTNEMLTYLHSCVSPNWHPVCCPTFPVDLDVMLCDANVLGGWEPQFGEHLDQPPHLVVPGRSHLRVCSVMSFPPQSMVGVLKALDRLQFPYRYSTRWTAYEKEIQRGFLEQTQSHWLGQEKGLWTQFSEVLSKQPSRMVDSSATNNALDADAARQEVGADVVAYGNFTATISVWDEDLTRVEAKLREVMQVLDTRGFTSIREAQHALPAWFSSHPGKRVDSVRRTPQHSLTLSHLMPGLQAAWPGVEGDRHLKQGPWFLAHTDGSTKFSVVNHVLDNGHFLVLGPTRSGKSTLANLMVASWLKYHGAQVSWWDIDGSARCLTLCLGGQWYDLGGDTISYQPLRAIDDPLVRGWAKGWLLGLAQRAEGSRVDLERAIDIGFDHLVKRPRPDRTLTELSNILAAHGGYLNIAASGGHRDKDGLATPDPRLRNLSEVFRQMGGILAPFLDGILDGDHDDLAEGPLVTFEQKTLLTMPHLVGPVTSYVFRRMGERFDTRRPMLVIMDDAAITWGLPDYQTIGKKWMTTTAKRNVSLGFFTHSLTQVFDSPLGGLLIESCPTSFVLPNPAARTPALASVYARMGFNPSEIAMIARMRPQRDYYYACDLLGKRPFRLNLSPLLLSMFAKNRAEDHDLMDALLAQYGPDEFGWRWLDAQGFPVEAQHVREELTHVADMVTFGPAADESQSSPRLSPAACG